MRKSKSVLLYLFSTGEAQPFSLMCQASLRRRTGRPPASSVAAPPLRSGEAS